MTGLSRSSLKAFARCEILALIAAGVLLQTIALPGRAKAKAKATRIMCVNQLKDVGVAFRSYAVDHFDHYPMTVATNAGGSAEYVPGIFGRDLEIWRHFWVMSNELHEPRFLVCPSDTSRYEATNWVDMALNNKARNASISYGVGVEASEAKPGMLLAADRTFWGGAPKFEFNNRSTIGPIGTNVASLQSLKWDEKAMHQNAGNAALADGSVRQLTSEGLRAALEASGDSINTYSQPGKSSSQ